MNTSEKKYDPSLLKTLSSIQFGIVVIITISIVSIIGTVIPQGQSADFYNEHYGPFIKFIITVFRFDITYSSPLFIGILCLFSLNLFLCTLIKLPALLRITFKPDLSPGAEKIARMSINTSIDKTSIDDYHSFGLVASRCGL